MTLQEAADRLIAIVGHDPAIAPPASVLVPWHAWEAFVNAAHPMRTEDAPMFPMSETPPPVEEPPPEEPPPSDDEEDEDKANVKHGAHKRHHRHTR
jgi:hypothetical protein